MTDSLHEAVAELTGGGVVAFPTETVYGLGADARSDAAVGKIYEMKGRPGTNPLIVHVHDAAGARACTSEWPDAAELLAKAFWPGPLTLVLRKGQGISGLVTAGRETVGVRVPDHALALEMLRAFGGPVAAPSANKSTRVSPTTAAHVRDEFSERELRVILDGGACRVGIESTVLDLSRSRRAVILRPGGVSQREIEAVIGPVEVWGGKMDEGVGVGAGGGAASPGMSEVHYAPRTAAYRFRPEQRGKLVLQNAAILEMTLDPQTTARNLYARLRHLDGEGLSAIYVEEPPAGPEWAAVRDRIVRATKELEK